MEKKAIEVVYITRTGSVIKKIPKSAWDSEKHGFNIKREGYRLATLEEIKKDPTISLVEIKKEVKKEAKKTSKEVK